VVGIRALDRKMLRDLWRMRAQALAIAFVVTAGVTTYISMTSVSDTLQGTLERYYREYRFAEGFASLRRAPEQVGDRLRGTPGVARLQTRVVAGVNLEVPGFSDPVMGLLVSVPEGEQPGLNQLFLRQGRLVRAGSENEVVANEIFADAHGLRPGDSLEAIISGRRRELRIVGIALSPEFLMQVQPGSALPDPERFGVLWMGRSALAAAYDMDGAFNEVAFTLDGSASIDDVISRMDLILAPYGGRGGYGRDEHPSHVMIREEFRQLAGMATILPIIFLAVAAFLLNIVITRLISLQREQIAVLKAFGYRNLDVGLHYLKLVLIIALSGGAAGVLLGIWAGRAMGDLYLEFFRFPELHYTLRWQVVLTAVLLTTAAAMIGVVRSVARAVSLPPAEAMRPEPPATYRRTLVEKIGLQRLLDQPTRMILRSLERQPLKALLTSVGIASSCAILIIGLVWGDIIDHIIRVQYGLAQREDVTVTFVEPTAMAAIHELRAIPGVQHAEPFRMVPVRLRSEHRRHDVGIEGIPQDAYLRRILDTRLQPIPVPGEGIVLTRRLSELLQTGPGDEIIVEVLEGRRRTSRVQVAAVAEQYLGLGAYMEIGALNRLTGSGAAASGALLLTDELHETSITTALRSRPAVASITSPERAIAAYMEGAAGSLLVMTLILSLFAGVIGFGVIYNSIRISLSERDRELASMRVLGFTRGEVAFVLLGEVAVLVLLAIPLGFAMGAAGASASVRALETDMFSFPMVLERDTFGLAAVIVLVAAIASALLVRRQLNRLDMVAVLKARE
jgi:putative ABC transport system permease protein